jgi:hypothetical protein
MKSHIATALALTLALGAAPAFAGQNPPPPEQQPPARAAQASMVRGDLVSVDATAKSLTVKTADDTEVKFLYNDKTEISGAKDGAAGLATMTEGRVTVHFTEDAQAKTKLATRIIVEPKK